MHKYACIYLYISGIRYHVTVPLLWLLLIPYLTYDILSLFFSYLLFINIIGFCCLRLSMNSVSAYVVVDVQTSIIRFCNCVKFEPICLLSGIDLIFVSQWAHSKHFFCRSSRVISTPP